MSTTLFSYQEDLTKYIAQIGISYDIMASAANEYLGGFGNKTALDLGVGCQLTHGGLTLALALQDGAKQCFGIDITHPELHSTDAAKVVFWRHAKETLGVEVQGLNEDRAGSVNLRSRISGLSA